MNVKLVRDGEGGYVTRNGRWTVKPIEGMGSGVNNNHGWSNGHREWIVTDTKGEITLSRYGPPHEAMVLRLYEARDLIAAHDATANQAVK